MSDHERICAKLNKVQNYYDELKSLSSISLDEYLGNSIYRRAVERTLQLIVESATDINNMLLKMLGQKGAEALDSCVLPIESSTLNKEPSLLRFHWAMGIELSHIQITCIYPDSIVDNSIHYRIRMYATA